MKSNAAIKSKTHVTHEVLRQFPYNIFVIGAGSTPREENAFIAAWVMQCSFEPALLAVGIRNDSVSHKLVAQEGIFTVNIIDKEHSEIARRLVRPQHRVGNKLGQISHFEEETGAPLLREAIAFLECRVVNTVTTGDHTIFIGEVVNSDMKSDEVTPLACSDMGWRYGG